MIAAVLSLAFVAFAQPAPVWDNVVWEFTETEEGVRLQYGQSESDDVPASLVCQKGTNRAELYLVIQHRIANAAPGPDGDWVDAQGRPAPWPITLTLSGVTLDAEAANDELNGGSTASVVLPTEHAVLKTMAASGQVRAEAFGETIVLPPFRKADFRRFLQGCKG